MFIDKKCNENIEEVGFHKLELLDYSTIENLKKLFLDNFENKLHEVDMTVTHNKEERTEAIFIHSQIENIVRVHLDKHFTNYEIFASHFSVKKAHSETAFQLHQDWSVVDERKYKNYQIWIPLDISYPENGGMCFIPNSHRFFNNLRSGSLGMPHIPIEEELHPYLSYCRLIPREAVVFFNNTFHGSFINSTPEKRVAVIINIVEKQAPTCYFHKNEDNNIDVYSLDTLKLFTFLPQLEKGDIPLNEIIEKNLAIEKFDSNQIDKYTLIDKVIEYNTKKKRAKDYEHKIFHTLKNKALESEINHLGFSTIQLIGDQKVKQIQDFFNSIFGTDRSKYPSSYSSVSCVSASDRRKIHDYIQHTIQNELSEIFDDFKVGITLLYSRHPDNNYFLDWHSDPSIILNESTEPVYGFWCPLVDIDHTSGGFILVPGSHRLSNKLNGSYQTWDWMLSENRRILDKYGVGFNLKAGEAIIFDTRIVHGSKPNYSGIERDNFVIRVLHKNSELINVNYKGKNKGTLYTQDENYFIRDTVKNHNQIPETGKKIGDIYLYKQPYETSAIEVKLSAVEVERFQKTNPNKIFFSHR